MRSEPLDALKESRRREQAQIRFYRALAAQAEAGGRETEGERLNGLHADEQHHLSRLSARILELGGDLGGDQEGDAAPGSPALEGWEGVAREREEAEVRWYRQVLTGELDSVSRALVEEILEAEVIHARELGGKWMSA